MIAGAKGWERGGGLRRKWNKIYLRLRGNGFILFYFCILEHSHWTSGQLTCGTAEAESIRDGGCRAGGRREPIRQETRNNRWRVNLETRIYLAIIIILLLHCKYKYFFFLFLRHPPTHPVLFYGNVYYACTTVVVGYIPFKFEVTTCSVLWIIELFSTYTCLWFCLNLIPMPMKSSYQT